MAQSAARATPAQTAPHRSAEVAPARRHGRPDLRQHDQTLFSPSIDIAHAEQRSASLLVPPCWLLRWLWEQPKLRQLVKSIRNAPVLNDLPMLEAAHIH